MCGEISADSIAIQALSRDSRDIVRLTCLGDTKRAYGFPKSFASGYAWLTWLDELIMQKASGISMSIE